MNGRALRERVLSQCHQPTAHGHAVRSDAVGRPGADSGRVLDFPVTNLPLSFPPFMLEATPETQVSHSPVQLAPR